VPTRSEGSICRGRTLILTSFDVKTYTLIFSFAAATGALALLDGCTVGPMYQPPTAATPAAYRYAAAEDSGGGEIGGAAGVGSSVNLSDNGGVSSQGHTDSDNRDRGSSPVTGSESGSSHDRGNGTSAIVSGPWWVAYQDPVLADLIARALAHNHELDAALARVDQARAYARLTRAALLPSLDANGDWAKFHLSRDTANVFPVTDGTDASVGLDLNYEIDFWGRVRRSVAAGKAAAVASADDYAALQLSVSTEVAVNYFSLRSLDAEAAVLTRAIELRQESVSLTTSRAHAHLISEMDSSRATAELSSTRAQLVQVQRQRSKEEEALALLVGESASTFQLAAQSIPSAPPSIPLDVPSALVAHRPDLAAAERRLAVASNQVGIAMTGYFPTVRLMASGGYEAEDSKTLLQWGSRFLQAGPSVSLPLFNAGRTRSQVDASKARLAEAQAVWQQNVLVAFNEVEDALHDQALLHELNQRDAETVAAAHDVAQLSEARYRGGLVNYLDVVDAQRTELEAQRSVVQSTGQRFIASVELVKALGGGWSAAPSQGSIRATAVALSE